MAFPSWTFLNIHNSASYLNKDLKTTNEWAFQWKMSFNPDPNKQSQEVIFSGKSKNIYHFPLIHNKWKVFESTAQKHLGFILDNRLSFQEYLTAMGAKVSRTIALFVQSSTYFTKTCFDYYLQIFSSFLSRLRRHSLHQSIQWIFPSTNRIYSIWCLSSNTPGTIRGSSREKIYQELGLESLQHRQSYEKLCYFYKIYNKKSPDYPLQLIPSKKSWYTTRNADNIPFFKYRHTFFKNSFFLSTIIEWNKLAPDLRNSDSYSAFKKYILNLVHPSPNSIFNCPNPKALKFITRLCLCLSHLRYHKIKNNFRDSLNPLLNCDLNIESTSHYFLHCPLLIINSHKKMIQFWYKLFFLAIWHPALNTTI